MKAGDKAVKFTATLTKDGAAYDLTDKEVYFVLKAQGKDRFESQATVVSALDGDVEFVSSATGFPTVTGLYEQNWQVWTTGKGQLLLTFPSEGFNELEIERNI